MVLGNGFSEWISVCVLCSVLLFVFRCLCNCVKLCVVSSLRCCDMILSVSVCVGDGLRCSSCSFRYLDVECVLMLVGLKLCSSVSVVFSLL